ncbi:hypothetical protein Bsp3421_000051 (plasmid) [Burkholderia sp. FERM BP-3421]|uniref:hypothetical protein n=1 Tax=Burkholderia sp. FERM BP-3421 TaxID=1494466 RepID=UPI0023603D06|nr:hypothetical protein [Burkholderia sp. FERM BP-3421]WDD90230.1 hypothetical protein Bsp3421_000051 [Burkholderia sp. FERM BP-3421]
MALFQIPVQSADGYPTAAMTPDHVVALRASPAHAGHVEIRRNGRTAAGQVVTLTTPLDLAQVAGLFEPFVTIEVVGAVNGPSAYHVRAGAIVAVQPLANGNGHVWLVNHEELFVPPAALAVLAGQTKTASGAPAPAKI